MLITGGFWTKALIPGTVESFPVSERATSSAFILRSSDGFRFMISRPWFTALDPPRLDIDPLTLGSCCTMAAASS
jgi:hypothetical protein